METERWYGNESDASKRLNIDQKPVVPQDLAKNMGLNHLYDVSLFFGKPLQFG